MKKIFLLILSIIIVGSISGCVNVPYASPVFNGENITNISLCGGDVVCIKEIAFNTKNETICEMLPEENRGQCFGQVGIAKLDESLCNKTGTCLTCQQECYSYISSKKNISDRCERMVDN